MADPTSPARSATTAWAAFVNERRRAIAAETERDAARTELADLRERKPEAILAETAPTVRHLDWLTDMERDGISRLAATNKRGELTQLVAHIKALAMHTARVAERKKVTADMLARFTHLTECGGEECNCWAPDAAVQHVAEAMPWHVHPSERPS